MVIFQPNARQSTGTNTPKKVANSGNITKWCCHVHKFGHLVAFHQTLKPTGPPKELRNRKSSMKPPSLFYASILHTRKTTDRVHCGESGIANRYIPL